MGACSKSTTTIMESKTWKAPRRNLILPANALCKTGWGKVD